MTHSLYLDIETLPTTDSGKIAEIASGITAPGNYTKADTIAKWETETKPGVVAEAVSKTAFNGAYGTIACICWAWNDGEPICIDARDGDEKRMLTEFSKRLIPSLPEHFPTMAGLYVEEDIKIVGHYVGDFDVRFIWQRAFVNEVRMPAFWPLSPKPWGNEIVDTMRLFAGAKDTISLDNLCKALGIAGKDGFDGSMVDATWEAGEYDRVVEYCKDDVERVRKVYKKMKIALGERS